jgi:hypothetical protein
MPIRINCHDKKRISRQLADIPLVMTDLIFVSQASYMDHEAVSGLLYGPI